MNADPTLDIARALIWEGYCLYPYRPSALKNRQRILFGTLVPERRADVRVTNASSVASVECLIAADSIPAVRATLRFLFGDSEC
jgi:hydrogenase maturation protease